MAIDKLVEAPEGAIPMEVDGNVLFFTLRAQKLYCRSYTHGRFDADSFLHVKEQLAEIGSKLSEYLAQQALKDEPPSVTTKFKSTQIIFKLRGRHILGASININNYKTALEYEVA